MGRVISEKGRIDKLLLFDFSNTKKCLEDESLMDGVTKYFIQNAKFFNPCIVFYIGYNGNLPYWLSVGNGDVNQVIEGLLCNPQDHELIAQLNLLFNEANTLLKKFNVDVTNNQEMKVLEQAVNNVSFSSSNIKGLKIGNQPNYLLQDLPIWSRLLIADFFTAIHTELTVNVDPRTGKIKSWSKKSDNKGQFYEQEIVLLIEEAVAELAFKDKKAAAPDAELLKQLVGFNVQFTRLIQDYLSAQIKDRYSGSVDCGKIRAFNLDEVCNSTYGSPGKDCVDTIKKELHDWVRDQFHVRINKEGKVCLNPSLAPVGLLGLFSEFSSTLCCGIDSQIDDPLHGIAGGNMIVYQQLAFIGADELLGREEVDMRKAIFDNEKDESFVFWIGTGTDAENTYDAGKGFQPMFHIDLFFHPLGFINKQATREFHFLFANLPENGHLSESQKPYYDALRLRLRNTLQKLCSDLIDAKFVPIAHQVDLGVYYELGGRIPSAWYSTFLNGISEIRDGSTRFYFPENDAYGPHSGYWRSKFGEMQSRARCQIEKVLGKQNVIPIPDTYGTENGALHCRVKVLSRTNYE